MTPQAELYLEANLNTIRQLGTFHIVQHDAPHGMVFFHSLPISLNVQMLYDTPQSFLQHVNEMLLSVGTIESSRANAAPRVVPRVDERTFGKVYNLTRTSQTDAMPKCTICLEPLLAEGRKWAKVWQLHGPQCTFHVRCLRKWHEGNCTCPNCGLRCEGEAAVL